MSDKIGVFVCYCGGNISDFVDVEKVKDTVSGEEGVAYAKTNMFTCSDSAQTEMIEAIKEKNLDGIVIASCSPKLHLKTFQNMAQRAGLNPYQYTQVNIREQCSWAHTHNKEAATAKAIDLVRAGIAKTRNSIPLTPLRVNTVNQALIIGGGISGLRCALALSEMGIFAHVVEKESKIGGNLNDIGLVFPDKKNGYELIDELAKEINKRDNIKIYTNARLTKKQGSVGNFECDILSGDEELTLNVGSIILTTGFKPYSPKTDEFGYGHPNVITLVDFKKLLSNSSKKDELIFNGQKIREIAYIYCVGSRESTKENGNKYCSRYCCSAVNYTSLLAFDIDPKLKQYHIYRDIRTYGKYEEYYEENLRRGALFFKYDEENPPDISSKGERIKILVKDRLIAKDDILIPCDLLVLVNGMVANENTDLNNILKTPIGKDKFYNEIHPKLRPVETVIDGIFIAGTSQGPKNISESVASSMAAASKTASLLIKGYVDIEPTIAHVIEEKCTGCKLCESSCPYEAISFITKDDKLIANINPAICKGCGGCVPDCPEDALEVLGYTHSQINSMINSMLLEAKEC